MCLCVHVCTCVCMCARRHGGTRLRQTRWKRWWSSPSSSMAKITTVMGSATLAFALPHSQTISTYARKRTQCLILFYFSGLRTPLMSVWSIRSATPPIPWGCYSALPIYADTQLYTVRKLLNDGTQLHANQRHSWHPSCKPTVAASNHLQSRRKIATTCSLT